MSPDKITALLQNTVNKSDFRRPDPADSFLPRPILAWLVCASTYNLILYGALGWSMCSNGGNGSVLKTGSNTVLEYIKLLARLGLSLSNLRRKIP